MENDLISRKALLDTLRNHFGQDLAYLGEDLQYCQEAVQFAPAVDAEPVRHGRWVDAGLGFMMLFSCSACKRQAILSGVDSYDYCPNCGLPMDAKEDA